MKSIYIIYEENFVSDVEILSYGYPMNLLFCFDIFIHYCLMNNFYSTKDPELCIQYQFVKKMKCKQTVLIRQKQVRREFFKIKLLKL